MNFEMAVEPEPGLILEEALVFAFRNDQLLVLCETDRCRVPLSAELETMKTAVLKRHYLGKLDNQPCFSVELDPFSPEPADGNFMGLRELFGMIDEEIFAMALHAVQIVDWDRMHQFCGRCGAKTEYAVSERAKVCRHCSAFYYPRIAPAVIVAVRWNDRLLLLRNKQFRHDFYSVLAGFVEPGETLEECLIREVREEAGIEVKNIRYFASQPWPFPNTLMIGFTADYAGGLLRPDGEEISDAGWFRVDEFPPIPGAISIARKLIDAFVEEQKQPRR